MDGEKDYEKRVDLSVMSEAKQQLWDQARTLRQKIYEAIAFSGTAQDTKATLMQLDIHLLHFQLTLLNTRDKP